MLKTMPEIENAINQGPFSSTWASLTKKKIPMWFKNRKFGIFIHWGLYSIPAFNNEWYSRNMYHQGSPEYLHHIKTFGPHKEFGYKDFIKRFKAEHFDPQTWAQIIKRSGAGYVFPVAEHHDGFAMYHSEISPWNSFTMGPKRDILGELKNAFEKECLVFCTSMHRAEHWFFMNGGTQFESDFPHKMEKGDFYWPAMPEKDPYDFASEPAPSPEFLEDWLMRSVEIIDQYQPKLLYLDWWVQHQAFKPYLKKLAAYYYNVSHVWDYETMICYKHDAMAFGSGIVEVERGKFASVKPFCWQTETAIADNSWCYTHALEYKSSKEIIITLIDVVSKNGNLLLNIGPKGDGTIPEYEVGVLRDIGDWLQHNGEAIYDAAPYRIFGEGETTDHDGQFTEGKIAYQHSDFRFTVSGGCVYATCLNPLGVNRFLIKSFRKGSEHDPQGVFSQIINVSMLGSDEEVVFNQDNVGLSIKIMKEDHRYPIVFKIELA